MTFAEVRLDLGIDYGTVGGPRFSTTTIVDGSGAEQRNANWSQPLGRWQIGDRSLTRDELEYFLEFHAARKGAAEGFRFKDWADYQAFNQLIGIGNGSKGAFQLFKSYKLGVYTAIRPISKPVGGTVKIYSNGTQLTNGWSLDVTTGIVTFSAAPGVGVSLTADFEFDVPVRFEQDKIDFRFDAYEVETGKAIFYLASLSVMEVRIAPTIPISPSTVPGQINETLDLGYDYGTVGGPNYSTTITAIGSGYERRTSNWGQPLGRWQIGDRTLSRTELDYLIAFFRVTRGAATRFIYQDWQRDHNVPVRFENDAIEFRFDAIDIASGEAIFYLSGISILETKSSIPVSYSQFAITPSLIGISSCYTISYNCFNGKPVPIAGNSGRYRTVQELTAALIQPGFSGGQCDGIRYRIIVDMHRRNWPSPPYAANTPNNTDRLDFVVWGPIKRIWSDWLYPNDPRNNSVSPIAFVECRGIYKENLSSPDRVLHRQPQASGIYMQGVGGADRRYLPDLSHNIISITRTDGQPDNCGNASAVCPP